MTAAPIRTTSASLFAFACFCQIGCGSSYAVDDLIEPADEDGEPTGETTAPQREAEGDREVDVAVGSDPGPSADSPTHGSDVDPNYDLVFDPDRVHTLHIAMPPETFQHMRDDLDGLLSSSGGFRGGEGAPPALPEGWMEACADLAQGDPCKVDDEEGRCIDVPIGDAGMLCVPDNLLESRGGGGRTGGGERRGALDLIGGEPTYVDVDITYEGETWSHVGMRFKGNSSLASSVRTGVEKLPFRLDFDEYEDEFPQTMDQRFHGFKKLTFSSNYTDQSLLRDTLFNEILHDRGLPAPRTAFYRVFVDTGDGEVYWGLYTMIEDPADGAMLDREFGSDDGNLYKPESTWASFEEAEFPKKTNELLADFSDVQAAIEALHGDRSDPEDWRESLEAVFDVDAFLRWLAVNTVVVEWDSYGRMPHNYYVYGDPNDDGRLVWIAWDHNMSMSTRTPFGGGSFDDIFHTGVDERWPLISYLLADELYAERYRDAVEDALQGAFALDAFEQRVRELHEMIEPHVVGEMGEHPPHSNLASEDAFLESVESDAGLIEHVRNRHRVVEQALSER